MSVLFIADWHEISPGEYYRKTEIYAMEWEQHIDLENFCLVGALYGGPMAIIKDDKKLLRVTAAVTAKPVISLYTAAGTLISTIKWDSGTLVKMGWSNSEDLLCVQEDGNILVYSIFGQLKDTVHCAISSETKEKAYEAEVFYSTQGTGIAYLTTKENFVVVTNYKSPKVRRYPRIPESEAGISCWTVLSKRQISVLVACESTIHVVDAGEITQERLEFNSPLGTNSPIVAMSTSLNGEHIAVFTESGMIWLGSSDFSQKYCEFSSGMRSKPKQLVWCGNTAVAYTMEQNLFLLTRKGKCTNFMLDSQMYVIPEIDCIRVVTNRSHELVMKVPKVSKDIFGIGSVEPSAMLVEASKEFLQESHKAHELIGCISQPAKAVEQCIEAAGYEVHPAHQKLLLKAAQFGKCFLTNYNPEDYIHMCQMLRVINSLRDYKIGIPLTFAQLEAMGIPVLIDRLILRRQYPLAIKIAEFLKLRDTKGRSRILNHWACYKVGQSHVADSQLANDIHSRLKSDPSISYSEIANKAFDAGRKKLALHLAQYEIRKSAQVKLYLKLGDHDTSLLKAVESGDSDLIQDVLLILKEKLPLRQFQVLIRKYPTAQSLYLKYCKVFDADAVRDVYEQEDDFMSQAAMAVRESYSKNKVQETFVVYFRSSVLTNYFYFFPKKTVESRLSSLFLAQELFKKAKNEFMASLCEEQHRLLKYQIQLEQNYSRDCVGLTLRDTIKVLLRLPELKLAEKLRAEFKVSDRTFWWIRLETIGEDRNWIELDKLSKTKKLPGGFEDFVETCLKADDLTEAQKYLPKVKDDLKINYYLLAGLYEEAAQIAVLQKDEDAMQHVFAKALSANRSVAEKVRTILETYKSATGKGSR